MSVGLSFSFILQAPWQMCPTPGRCQTDRVMRRHVNEGWTRAEDVSQQLLSFQSPRLYLTSVQCISESHDVSGSEIVGRRDFGVRLPGIQSSALRGLLRNACQIE